MESNIGYQSVVCRLYPPQSSLQVLPGSAGTENGFKHPSLEASPGLHREFVLSTLPRAKRRAPPLRCLGTKKERSTFNKTVEEDITIDSVKKDRSLSSASISTDCTDSNGRNESPRSN